MKNLSIWKIYQKICMVENSIIVSLLYPLIFVSPAYVTNSSPLFLSSLVQNTHPLDFGKNFLDGKRIFGNGKTIEGTIFGIFMGIIYFIILKLINDFLSIVILYYSFLDGLPLVFGAILGDLVGSFIKRRLNIKQGEMLPVFDQLGFLVFSLLLYSAFFDIPISFDSLIYVLFITFFAHVLTNLGAYFFKIKNKPY